MTNVVKQAGAYTLKKFEITPLYESGKYTKVDLSRVIVNWAFTESMDSPFISGSAVVLESFDLLTSLPIRGEEKLIVQYIDQFENEYTYEFVIYAVTDIEVDNNNSKLLKYTISFCTPQKLNYDWQYVRKSYGDDLISNMAEDVFRRYMSGERDIEIEKTDGRQTLVIPRFRPDEAMMFLARKAYSTNRESSLYFFFENTEKFYFCTYEHLVDKYRPLVETAEIAKKNELKYIYSQYNDNSPYGQAVARFAVSNLQYIDRSNSIAAMKNGAYRRKVTELDYYNRTRNVTSYDYIENIDKHAVIDDLKVINTTDYVNRYMPEQEAPEAILVTDYNQLGIPQGKDYSLSKYRYLAETNMRKSMISYYRNTNEVSCTINGNGKLKAGMLIWLDVFKFSEEGDNVVPDKERNGRYQITTITHTFSGDYYKQGLRITKGGLGKT